VSNIDEHSRPSQACGASGCRNGGATAIEVAQQSVQRRRAASGARVNGTLIGSNLEDRAAALSLERVVVLRSPSSASGRVCEIPNGRFVEAKQENQWLDVRLLWSNPDGGFGSVPPVRDLLQR